jgi:hypothetical protein
MADSIKAKFDGSQFDKVFAALSGPIKESLARRMGVAGGRIIRDEAAANALIPGGPHGRERRRVLSNAMYVAYDKRNTQRNTEKYIVSWNSRHAPHGHFIEYGYLQPYVVYFNNETGEWRTRFNKKEGTFVLLKTPKFVPAYPFLRPALDRKGADALRAMIDAGKKELPVLLKENGL